MLVEIRAVSKIVMEPFVLPVLESQPCFSFLYIMTALGPGVTGLGLYPCPSHCDSPSDVWQEILLSEFRPHLAFSESAPSEQELSFYV